MIVLPAILVHRLTSKVFLFGTVYLLILLALRLLTNLDNLLWLGNLTFFLGGLLGLFVDLLDKLVYIYFTRPETAVAEQFKNLVSNKQWRQAATVLNTAEFESRYLATTNILFLMAWLVLAIFLVTSSLSQMSKGMVLTIGFVSVFSIFQEWSNKPALMERLFWPIRKQLGEFELKVTVAVLVVALLLLSLMTI